MSNESGGGGQSGGSNGGRNPFTYFMEQPAPIRWGIGFAGMWLGLILLSEIGNAGELASAIAVLAAGAATVTLLPAALENLGLTGR